MDIKKQHILYTAHYELGSAETMGLCLLNITFYRELYTLGDKSDIPA